jgi:hypothetical protein
LLLNLQLNMSEILVAGPDEGPHVIFQRIGKACCLDPQ